MKEFQEYTGRDLYDYCCGYILKRESIWNGSAVQYSDQIEKKIKGVLKRRKAGSYNADRTAYIQKIIGEMQVEVLNFSGETPSKFYIRKENTEGYAALDDADIEGMTDYFHARYADVNREIIEEWVRYSVYLWYLR